MNQTEFGALLNASQYDISGYEQGKYDPKVTVMIRLEELTGISVSVLYGQGIDVNKLPALPLKPYTIADKVPNIVAEEQATYNKKVSHEVVQEDLIDVLKLVETVKALQKEMKQMSEKMKGLQQEINDLQQKSS